MLLMNMKIITFKAADVHNESLVVQLLKRSTLCRNIMDHNKTLCRHFNSQCRWEVSLGFPILKQVVFILTRTGEVGRDLWRLFSTTSLLTAGGHLMGCTSHFLSLYKDEDSVINLGWLHFPIFAPSDKKKGFPGVWLPFPVFQFVSISLCPVTGHHWQMCSIKYFWTRIRSPEALSVGSRIDSWAVSLVSGLQLGLTWSTMLWAQHSGQFSLLITLDFRQKAWWILAVGVSKGF